MRSGPSVDGAAGKQRHHLHFTAPRHPPPFPHPFLSHSVTLHPPHPLPVPFSPLLFICFPSLLSQAFYCVTHADSAAPPLVPRLCRRAPEKVVAFVWQTCHLMPHPTPTPKQSARLHKSWGFTGSLKKLSLVTTARLLPVRPDRRPPAF